MTINRWYHRADLAIGPSMAAVIFLIAVAVLVVVAVTS